MVSIVNDSPEIRERNALAAIPLATEQPLAAGAIFKRQVYPRMSLQKLRSLLARKTHEKEIERRTVGTKFHYYRHLPGALAHEGDPVYTQPQRKSFSCDEPAQSIEATHQSPAITNYFVETLRPLRLGAPVMIWMEVHSGISKQLKGKQRAARRLIVINSMLPDPVKETLAPTVLVSLIGSGSCFVVVDAVRRSTNIAHLVLAGCPAKLAANLMDTLYRVFLE